MAWSRPKPVPPKPLNGSGRGSCPSLMQPYPDAQILLQPESRRLKRRCRKPVRWVVGHPPLLHRYAQPVAVQLLVGVFIVQHHHGVIARWQIRYGDFHYPFVGGSRSITIGAAGQTLPTDEP